jgi:hypothetical protein
MEKGERIMRTRIPNRTPDISWLTKFFNYDEPARRAPAEQQVYDPVTDRRQRKTWNAADPTRRETVNAIKRIAKQAAANKLSRRERVQAVDSFFAESETVAKYGLMPTDDELLNQHITSVLATEPNAGKRRRQALIRKAKSQFLAGKTDL